MIEQLMKVMSDARKQSAGNLAIGEMLKKLNNFNDDEKVTFSDGKFFDGTYDSYRGYYEDMYLGWDDEDKGFNTVGQLKETLNKALDDGGMTGYKGGEFSINNSTLVWFSNYGSTGDMIVDIQKINGEIYVITKEDEW